RPRAGCGCRRTSRTVNSGTDGGVSGRGEAPGVERVESCAEQGRALDGELEDLAFDDEARVARIGTRLEPAATGVAHVRSGLVTLNPHQHGLLVHAEPSGETPGIFTTQRPVLEPRDHGRRLRKRLHAPLGQVEVELGERRADRELGQRHVTRDEIAYGEIASLLPKIAWVEAVRLDRDKRLRDEALIVGAGHERGFASGLIAVERADEPATDVALVHPIATRPGDMLNTE